MICLPWNRGTEGWVNYNDIRKKMQGEIDDGRIHSRAVSRDRDRDRVAQPHHAPYNSIIIKAL